MLNVVAPSAAVATATESVAVLALPLLLPHEPIARLSIRAPNAGKNSFLISKVFFLDRAFVYPYGENRITVLLLRAFYFEAMERSFSKCVVLILVSVRTYLCICVYL